MSHTAWTLLLFFAPLLVLIAVGRIRLLIRRKRMVANDEPAQPTPFEPKPEPTPGFWLRRFNRPERTYLRQQLGTVRVGFYIVTWSFFALGSSGLLPGNADHYAEWPAGSPQAIWSTYLQSALMLNILGALVALGTSITAGYGLLPGMGTSAMNRTRPLSLRLLYWGRVGPALVTLLAGFTTGILLSLGLLVALHGPVWRHLDWYTEGMQVTMRQLHRLNWLLNLSPGRLMVSAATSLCMIFAMVVCFLYLPLGKKSMSPALSWVLPFCIYEFFSTLGPMLLPRVSRTLFLYGLTTKTPPPWSAALVPVFITAALLYGGQLLYRRSEP